MKEIKFQNHEVKKVFDNYPIKYKFKLLALRNLIFSIAKTNGIGEVEETLRWGEPSYISKKGSTIRIDWKEKSPNNYGIYFKCTSLLVPTFKKLYPKKFHYEGTRAILFKLNDKIPKKELTHCIEMALNYHNIKKDLKELGN
ncbi:MAG: DUF1801 domain-containing protein [Leptospiraceae bacterium]|nr:DUF1801 domain-containing protein [Leptospiraceae bacterium]